MDGAAGGIGPAQMNAVSKGFEFTMIAPLHSERPPLTTPLVVGHVRTSCTASAGRCVWG